MERKDVAENKLGRERLKKLVSRITDDELRLQLYTEGWTVAVALAHLAFWDQRRLLLVRRWEKEGISPSPVDENLVNDALLPFFLALNPRKAAELAVSIAGELDRELEGLPSDLIEGIDKLGDRHALNRSIHRKMHLDEIEKLLEKH
jgi:hypothetical protein